MTEPDVVAILEAMPAREVLVAEAGSGVAAEDVGSRAARAIRRDRAHEPHPDLPPGRFRGGLTASPPGTWELARLESAERPDFEAMTSEAPCPGPA